MTVIIVTVVKMTVVIVMVVIVTVIIVTVVIVNVAIVSVVIVTVDRELSLRKSNLLSSEVFAEPPLAVHGSAKCRIFSSVCLF